jgi:outer membrane protein TolC
MEVISDGGVASRVVAHAGNRQLTQGEKKPMGKWSLGVVAVLALFADEALCLKTQAQAAPQRTEQGVQLVQPAGPGQQAPPVTITLKDALQRASGLDPNLVSALNDEKDAQQDKLQARNALLPQLGINSEYWNTEGNGRTTDGRFVTNDGVHVYQDWVTFHEDLSPANLMHTAYKRADAAQAVARAKSEIARRGLTVTVTKDFYALAVAQRKYATAQEALDEANRFLAITQAQEAQGLAPRSDVIKAQVQAGIQQTTFDDATLAIEDARLDLTVLIFPSLNENFTVVDDLDSPTALPTFGEVQNMASRDNPDIRAAMETLRESDLDVKAAKNAQLPTLTVETDWGLQANAIGVKEVQSAFPELGPVGTLGYQFIAIVNMPVWDWGTLRSKVHQAEYKQDAAKVQLSQIQRQTLGELYAAYNEAMVARDAVDKLRQTADLATESLRLVNLRYQAGESPATEVVDAETTLTTARNAYDDGQVRYRMALANLQLLTGAF